MVFRTQALALLILSAGSARAGSLAGSVAATGQKDNADAVVYVDQIAGKSFPAPSAHIKMDQVKMAFVPHVVAVLVGATVDFANSDTVSHNVFTQDKCAGGFNLGTWGKGQMKSYTFDKPCVADLLCSIHPDMEGFVVAVPTPYFAVTDKAGAYEIKDLPDGEYTIKVWHPRLKAMLQKVTVKDATKQDFKLVK